MPNSQHDRNRVLVAFKSEDDSIVASSYPSVLAIGQHAYLISKRCQACGVPFDLRNDTLAVSCCEASHIPHRRGRPLDSHRRFTRECSHLANIRSLTFPSSNIPVHHLTAGLVDRLGNRFRRQAMPVQVETEGEFVIAGTDASDGLDVVGRLMNDRRESPIVSAAKPVNQVADQGNDRCGRTRPMPLSLSRRA